MSEYWISQGRKMCTYCKCWTADNKASINFHEQGKNHKENVKKKLDELRKRGLEDAKRKQTEVSDMEKIEKAALASLQRDIASNPTMASTYGIAEDKLDAVQQAIAAKNSSSATSKSIGNKKTGAATATNSQSKKKTTPKQTVSRQAESSADASNSTVHYSVKLNLY